MRRVYIEVNVPDDESIHAIADAVNFRFRLWYPDVDPDSTVWNSAEDLAFDKATFDKD